MLLKKQCAAGGTYETVETSRDVLDAMVKIIK